jgi:cyanate permease
MGGSSSRWRRMSATTPTTVVQGSLASEMRCSLTAGAFGWVGLFLALAAEVGGPRYAGLLTGVAVSFAWSGVLLGPPLFGALLQATGSYGVPWLVLSLLAFGAAIALAAIPPLVKRE